MATDRTKIKPIYLIIGFLLFSNLSSLYGAYLQNNPVTIFQPDGERINCYESGDEFYNFLHDQSGYVIIKNPETGYFYYAENNSAGDLVPTNYLINKIDPRQVGLEKWIMISKERYVKSKEEYIKIFNNQEKIKIKAPISGMINSICILIKFSDQTEFISPRSFYDERFNAMSGVQSLKSYYDEVSYGNLEVNTTIYPQCASTINLSYSSPHPRMYFSPYNSASNRLGYRNLREARLREHSLLKDAIESISSQIPANLVLDMNGDGYNDNLCIILRGENGAWADVGLWAHSGVLDTYEISVNGARFYNYAIQPETQNNVYTLCHEMFHVLGAPDLYTYFNYDNPVGSWDIMASSFVHMGSHMKYKYSNGLWISQETEITQSGTYTLNPLTSSSNNCYKIKSPYSDDEYFILEYRLKSGMYELNVPNSGLIIYRINKTVFGNNYGPPYEEYIYRQHGSPLSQGNINNANFGPTSGRTEFNDFTTNPYCFLEDGSAGGIYITNITEPGATISFDVVIINCKISSPANNEIITINSDVNIEVTPSDSSSVSQIEFYIDNNYIYTDSTFPFSYLWNTSAGFNSGIHYIKVKAIGSNNVNKEDQIQIVLTNGEPILTLTFPENNSMVNAGSEIMISAELIDPLQTISRVSFYVNNELIESDLQTPYQCLWHTIGCMPGIYNIQAIAMDNDNIVKIDEIKVSIIHELLFEDFEGSWPPAGWSVNSSAYGWYQSDKFPYSGEKSAATRNYHAAGEAVLTTPQISIPNSGAQLDYYWIDRSLDVTLKKAMIAGHDSTFCEISIDQANWEKLSVLSAPDAQIEYSHVVVDLNAYAGQQVYIRWRDISDESLYTQGSSLDKIRVAAVMTGIDEEKGETALPKIITLYQNFPNPFNFTTTIRYFLPVGQYVKIRVFDIIGTEVAVIINKNLTAGLHQVVFNGSKLAVGQYFYKIEGEGFSGVRKMILIK